jgi:hypothetical protein
VSVSENAISSFERRGLPFRDVFDSAFDDIRHVDYLTLVASRHLLVRRVLNLPAPFLCLCHVLSGGLPRDLIRVTRNMLDMAQKNPGDNDLRSITGGLLRGEIVGKLRATAIAAREIPLEPEVTTFLARITELETFDPLSAATEDKWSVTLPTDRTDLLDKEKAMLRNLVNLGREIETFLRFAGLTAEVFVSMTSEAGWKHAEDSGWVERLAKARQALELNTGIAIFRLKELHDMVQLHRKSQ